MKRFAGGLITGSWMFNIIPTITWIGYFDEKQPMSEADSFDAIINREINLIIFEKLYGAKRAKLADDMCGLVMAGKLHGSFKGHASFSDEEKWEEHYEGPNFCERLDRMFEAEELLFARHLHRIYAETLVSIVCPAWQNLKLSDAVLEFWYALAHASSLQRARAVAKTMIDRHERG